MLPCPRVTCCCVIILENAVIREGIQDCIHLSSLGSVNWALRPSLLLQTNTLLQLANCSSYSALSQIYCLEVNLLVPSASLCRLLINNAQSNNAQSTKCKLCVLPLCPFALEANCGVKTASTVSFYDSPNDYKVKYAWPLFFSLQRFQTVRAT